MPAGRICAVDFKQTKNLISRAYLVRARRLLYVLIKEEEWEMATASKKGKSRSTSRSERHVASTPRVAPGSSKAIGKTAKVRIE